MLWQSAATEGVPYVPLVTTGWDKEPRKLNPVSWELDHSYHKQDVFPSVATPDEIASHLARAIDFVRANPKSARHEPSLPMHGTSMTKVAGWLAVPDLD
jgi:hypothetical protein